MTPIEPPARFNVNGYLLPIRLKSEPESVHVYAHRLTWGCCSAESVIAIEQPEFMHPSMEPAWAQMDSATTRRRVAHALVPQVLVGFDQ